MIFRICDNSEHILYRWDVVVLRPLDRKDSKFQTSFDVTYYDSVGRDHHFGIVKIGRKGMREGKVWDPMPLEFTSLSGDYFSLGQDEDYYERIVKLDKNWKNDFRNDFFQAMRDVAYDTELLHSNLKETVMGKSLLVDIVADDEKHRKAVAKIEGQFNRMAEKGGDRLTEYHFTYTAPDPKNTAISPAVLEFDVYPESNPPTNVHAMIGRNGCGKTYLIRNMVQCLQDREGPFGKFTYREASGESREFANVVCIAFSPFDAFPEVDKKRRDLPAKFVGLNEKMLFPDDDSVIGKKKKDGKEKEKKNILIEAICNQFWDFLRNCMITPRRQQLWKEAVDILKTGFDEYESSLFGAVNDLMKEMSDRFDDDRFQKNKDVIMSLFRPLSSGHKVVLLTITSCVAEIEERSILFLDEPENHLHPPLLSALIRALSDLLRKRNGVAIVSTHSPVVLQEVPKSCVWLLRRNGAIMSADRLGVQTFGASIGTLIDEVYKFEVTQTGFHNLLQEAIRQLGEYDPNPRNREQIQSDYMKVAEIFKKQLGDEADLHLRTLLLLRRKGVNI